MADLPWDFIITVVALAVSLFAFLWEFVFVGRKRLGHRVQMDTTVANLIAPEFSGDLLPELVENDRSYVLVRVENNGRTPIATSDYAVMPDNPVGIVIRFPNRRVTGMALTDLTPPTLDLSLRGSEHKPTEGLGTRNIEDGGQTVGLVELPKVPLNRGEHYKVLVSLESANGDRGPFPAPEVVGGISGGTFRHTKNRTGTSKRSVALAAFLSAALVGQQVYSLTATDAALDCASGELVLTGSTAFRPILDKATAAYEKTCSTVGTGAQGGVVRCERGSTQEVLDTVAATPGAIGYSEFGLAATAQGVKPVRINGFEATTEGVERKLYPFWETEIAYTYTVPQADALPASFLRYLTNQVGQDIIGASGHRPCTEMENPLLCRPV